MTINKEEEIPRCGYCGSNDHDCCLEGCNYCAKHGIHSGKVHNYHWDSCWKCKSKEEKLKKLKNAGDLYLLALSRHYHPGTIERIRKQREEVIKNDKNNDKM